MKNELLGKSLNELACDPLCEEKVNAYFSVKKIASLLKPFMNIKLKTLIKIPLPSVSGQINGLIDFICDETDKKLLEDERAILLWELPPCYSGKGKKPYIIPFLLEKEAPVVIVVPGGGYSSVSIDHEGLQVAKALNAAGFHAVVLNYRVSPARYPAPQHDLIRTIQLVRSKAKEWKIMPDKLTLLGFSAGGHLCSSVATLYDELAWQSGDLRHIDAKPNALVLGYPQIDLNFKVMNTPSGVFLLGSEATESDLIRLSSHNLVTADYPPTFIWSLEHDPLVKIYENCIPMMRELERHRVPCELHIYDGNEHGTGLSEGKPAEVWFNQAVKFIKNQLDL